MNKFKLIAAQLLVIMMALAAYGDGAVESTFNGSASGSTSATVVIPAANSHFEIRDLNWRIDSGTTTATIGIRPAVEKNAVTSATSASGTVIWFTNAGTHVAVGDYVIQFVAASNTYNLRRVLVATTTSITVEASISAAQTTNDFVFWVPASRLSERPVGNVSSTSAVSIWCPAGMPTAVTIDGNTTACRIQVSGARGQYK